MITKLENLIIRQMQLTDMDAVMQIKNAEKWNQTEQDWEFLMMQNPEYCLVACIDDEVVGTVTAINYDNQLAWIGMMLVSKAFRGLGISKTLLTTIIEKLKDCKSIKLDATPAGIPVYQKLGFVEEYEVCRMINPQLRSIYGKDDQDHHGKSELSLLPITESNIGEVSKADQQLFGVNRLYLFQYLLKQPSNVCWCLKQGGQILGYVFGRDGSNYFQVGPLLAQSALEAKILLKKSFDNLAEKPVVVDVLKQKQEIIDWLISIGFVEQRNFMRMFLHNNDYTGRIDKQYLISGPELG